jgi:hypothetical protein
MVAVVAPVLHRNVIPPVAVSETESPGQSGGTAQTIAHIGAGFTVTVVAHDDVHPLEAFVTVTVYVVVDVGFTVMDAVVAPVLHRNESPPDAVSVDEPPTQNEESVEVMLHAGGVISWFTTTSAKQLSFKLNGFVTEKRYVPPCVIRIESKPLTVSLIPGPS